MLCGIPTRARVPLITYHLSSSSCISSGHPLIQCNYAIVCNGSTHSVLGSITPLSLPRYSSGRRREGKGREGRSIKGPLLAQSPRNCSFPIMKEGRQRGY